MSQQDGVIETDHGRALAVFGLTFDDIDKVGRYVRRWRLMWRSSQDEYFTHLATSRRGQDDRHNRSCNGSVDCGRPALRGPPLRCRNAWCHVGLLRHVMARHGQVPTTWLDASEIPPLHAARSLSVQPRGSVPFPPIRKRTCALLPLVSCARLEWCHVRSFGLHIEVRCRSSVENGPL